MPELKEQNTMYNALIIMHFLYKIQKKRNKF